MSFETLKVLAPYVAGALGVVSVVLNFALGRYAAADPEHRWVWHTAASTLLLLVLTVSANLCLVFGFYRTSAAFFTTSFVVLVVQFLRIPGAAGRIEVVGFAFLCCAYTLLLGGFLVIPAFVAMTGAMVEMTDVISELIKEQKATAVDQSKIVDILKRLHR